MPAQNLRDFLLGESKPAPAAAPAPAPAKAKAKEAVGGQAVDLTNVFHSERISHMNECICLLEA